MCFFVCSILQHVLCRLVISKMIKAKGSTWKSMWIASVLEAEQRMQIIGDMYTYLLKSYTFNYPYLHVSLLLRLVERLFHRALLDWLKCTNGYFLELLLSYIRLWGRCAKLKPITITPDGLSWRFKQQFNTYWAGWWKKALSRPKSQVLWECCFTPATPWNFKRLFLHRKKRCFFHKLPTLKWWQGHIFFRSFCWGKMPGMDPFVSFDPPDLQDSGP